MAPRIIIVDDQPSPAGDGADRLRGAGYEVVAFDDPLAALNAFDEARPVDLLITRAQFGPGCQNGVSLALMAQQKRPDIKILFHDSPEYRHSTEGVGEFLAMPAQGANLVAAVVRLLNGGA
jgi:DNA-binding NtrC family response regulator